VKQPPSSDEVKDVWRYTSTLPCLFIMWCSIRQICQFCAALLLHSCMQSSKPSIVQCVRKVSVHFYKTCWKWCPWASIQACTSLILFANTFCWSACEMFLMNTVIAVFNSLSTFQQQPQCWQPYLRTTAYVHSDFPNTRYFTTLITHSPLHNLKYCHQHHTTRGLKYKQHIYKEVTMELQFFC
jgi:hypothetical protein